MEINKLEENDAADWTYRGEGAGNLVLAYTGSSPSFIRKVMRIQKASKNGESFDNNSNSNSSENVGAALTEQERLLWRENEELVTSPTKEIAQQLYTDLVISPLLGSKHVDSGVRVRVSREFLECVDKNVMCQRPAWRVKAAKVNLMRDSVLITPDHSLFPCDNMEGGPCISVEIKPKCGFLPSSRFIAEENAIKMSMPRFRLHQILKLQEQKISEISEYNPLDLFSGSKERIHKAIEELYTTPQNNFRVFLNGSLVFGGSGGGIKKTNIFVGEAFEDVLKGTIEADDGMRTSSFIQLVAETVYSSGVLHRLLEVQKLDELDIEGAIHAYYDIIFEPCHVCKELNESGMPNRYSSLHSIPMEESLKIVKNFLIAATAKDCSVMTSFRPTEDGLFQSHHNIVFLESCNQHFEYKVNFIDLDMKPLKKMEDYYKLDQRIMKRYNDIVRMENGHESVKGLEANDIHWDHMTC